MSPTATASTLASRAPSSASSPAPPPASRRGRWRGGRASRCMWTGRCGGGSWTRPTPTPGSLPSGWPPAPSATWTSASGTTAVRWRWAPGWPRLSPTAGARSGRALIPVWEWPTGSPAAGRWATAFNIEAAKSLGARQTGFLRGVELGGFFDGGLVDSLAIPDYNGRGAATPLYDAGVGLVTRQRLGDRSWTMRFEMPLVVNRWAFSADTHGRGRRTTFRWQVSLEPSF